MPLDANRVCRVVVSGGTSRRASGYLVAPDLVLTTAHVFEAAAFSTGTPLHVQPWDKGEVTGELVWRGAGDLDAALVSLPDGPVPLQSPPVRWGELTGTAPDIQVTAVGYPLVSRTPQGWRPPDQQAGSVHPITNEGLQYDVLLPGPYPEPVDGRSPWAGLSGAALFSGGLLIAVIRLDQPNWRHGRLGAVPVARLLHDAGFRAQLAAHGCGDEVDSVELDLLFDPPTDPGLSPAGLLRADNELVRFHGRDEILTELVEWCNGPDQLSLGLITGPGGQGKTRLARQLLRHVRRTGWVGGFLTEIRKPEAALAPILDSARPVLVVVDYAEGREEQVLELARVLSRGATLPVRILMLARAAGAWWADLTALRPRQCELGPELSLAPLDLNEQARGQAYRDAVEDFGTAMSQLPAWRDTDWPAITARMPPRDLADDAYGVALNLQMQALVDLLAVNSDSERTAGRAGLEATMLEHERGYWARTPGGPPEGRDLAVAAATLTGAATEQEATALLQSLDLLDHSARATARWLARLYPAAGKYWGSLQPDRIGEWLIAGLWRTDRTFLSSVLKVASGPQLRRAAVVLGRMAPTHADLRGEIVSLLLDVTIGGALLASVGPYVSTAMLHDLDDPTAQLLLTLVERRALTLARQSPSERASQLELAAHQAGHPEAARSLVSAFPDRPMRTRWVHWHPLPAARILEGGPSITAFDFAGAEPARQLVFGDQNGLVQAITLDEDPRPRPVTRHGGPVSHLHTALIDGRRHLVSLGERDPIGRVTPLDAASSRWTFTLPHAENKRFNYFSVKHLTAVSYRNGQPILALAFANDLWFLPLTPDDQTPRHVYTTAWITALTGATDTHAAVFLLGTLDGGIDRVTVTDKARVETLIERRTAPRTEWERDLLNDGWSVAKVNYIAASESSRWLAFRDDLRSAFVLRSDPLGSPIQVLTERKVDSIALATIDGRAVLIATAELDEWGGDNSLLVVQLDETTLEPAGEVRETALESEWRIRGLATRDGRILVLCANPDASAAQVISLERDEFRKYTVSPGVQLSATMGTRPEGVVIATLYHERERAIIEISRLPWDATGWPESDQFQVWDVLVGNDPGDNPVVALRHGIRSEQANRNFDTVLTVLRVDAGPPPQEFAEDKDYYYNRITGQLRSRTRRAAQALPMYVGGLSSELHMSVNNHFLREGQWTQELYRYGNTIAIAGRGNEDRVLVNHPNGESIYRYAPVRLTPKETVILYTSGDKLLMARCTPDGVTNSILVHTPDRRFGKLYLEQLGNTQLLVALSETTDDTEIWVSRLGTEQPPFRVATLPDRLAAIHLLQMDQTDIVVASRRSGHVTWYAVPDRERAAAPAALIDLGAPVGEYTYFADTLIAATADGVVAAELRNPEPHHPVAVPPERVEQPSGWRTFVERKWPDLARPPEPEILHVPWAPWAILGVLVLLAAGAAARNGPLVWTLPAWLYLAVLFWSDVVGRPLRWNRWSARLAVAGFLVGVPLAVHGQWDRLLAAFAAVPVAVIVFGSMTHEPTLPSGVESYTFHRTLTHRRRSWQEMAAGCWLLPRDAITAAQDRSWYAGLLALYLASISTDALLTGALLPVATGLIGSLIMRIIGAWMRIFDSHGVLFIGALIGVFVHLPITALIGLAR